MADVSTDVARVVLAGKIVALGGVASLGGYARAQIVTPAIDPASKTTVITTEPGSTGRGQRFENGWLELSLPAAAALPAGAQVALTIELDRSGGLLYKVIPAQTNGGDLGALVSSLGGWDAAPTALPSGYPTTAQVQAMIAAIPSGGTSGGDIAVVDHGTYLELTATEPAAIVDHGTYIEIV